MAALLLLTLLASHRLMHIVLSKTAFTARIVESCGVGSGTQLGIRGGVVALPPSATTLPDREGPRPCSACGGMRGGGRSGGGGGVSRGYSGGGSRCCCSSHRENFLHLILFLHLI